VSTVFNHLFALYCLLDHIRVVRLLHRRLYPHLLSQNSPQHASPSHSQLNTLRDVIAGRCVASTRSARDQRDPVVGSWQAGVDVDEAQDNSSRSVLYDRECL